jgi:hypothetical protein
MEGRAAGAGLGALNLEARADTTAVAAVAAAP